MPLTDITIEHAHEGLLWVKLIIDDTRGRRVGFDTMYARKFTEACRAVELRLPDMINVANALDRRGLRILYELPHASLSPDDVGQRLPTLLASDWKQKIIAAVNTQMQQAGSQSQDIRSMD